MPAQTTLAGILCVGELNLEVRCRTLEPLSPPIGCHVKCTRTHCKLDGWGLLATLGFGLWVDGCSNSLRSPSLKPLFVKCIKRLRKLGGWVYWHHWALACGWGVVSRSKVVSLRRSVW